MLLDTASQIGKNNEAMNEKKEIHEPCRWREPKKTICTPQCWKDAEDVFFKWRTCSSTGMVRAMFFQSAPISRYCTKVTRIHHPWPAPTHKKFQITCRADLQSGKTKSWALDFRVLKQKTTFSARCKQVLRLDGAAREANCIKPRTTAQCEAFASHVAHDPIQMGSNRAWHGRVNLLKKKQASSAQDLLLKWHTKSAQPFCKIFAKRFLFLLCDQTSTTNNASKPRCQLHGSTKFSGLWLHKDVKIFSGFSSFASLISWAKHTSAKNCFSCVHFGAS